MKIGKSVIADANKEDEMESLAEQQEEAEKLLKISPEETEQLRRRQRFEQKAVIRTCSRQRTVMGIIKYLLNHDVARLDEIAKAIPTPKPTLAKNPNQSLSINAAHYFLKRMEESGIVWCTIPPLDKRLRYYQLNKDFRADKAVERYHYRVSMRLYKLLPYDGVRVEDLKKDQQFINLCKYYHLTPEEGVEVLAGNTKKVRAEYSTYPETQLYKLYRKEQ